MLVHKPADSMVLTRVCLVLLGVVLTSPPLLRAQGELPSIVRRGLGDLAAGRPDTAFALWASSEAFGADERSQILQSVPMYKQACDKPRGYDVIRVVAVGRHVQRVFATLLCEVRPVYLMVAAYQGGTTWGITALNWSTDPDKILPPSLVPTQRP